MRDQTETLQLFSITHESSNNWLQTIEWQSEFEFYESSPREATATADETTSKAASDYSTIRVRISKLVQEFSQHFLFRFSRGTSGVFVEFFALLVQSSDGSFDVSGQGVEVRFGALYLEERYISRQKGSDAIRMIGARKKENTTLFQSFIEFGRNLITSGICLLELCK